MNASERAAHWQSIHSSKSLESCSWYQPVPQTSLDLIARLGLPQDAPILDVGGGDALLVDHLLERAPSEHHWHSRAGVQRYRRYPAVIDEGHAQQPQLNLLR